MWNDLTTILLFVANCGIAICWLVVLVTEIRHRDLPGSLLSIVPLAAFFVGWSDAEEYGLLTPMVAWTGCLLLAATVYYLPVLTG